ncbi:hypothetical protein GGR52DRAFT_134790 [Hypoxylon sp. FL1284]|nr:hypothetical protein GGR52DRAFT_134790 [Hypoxylon sp. FL1284]
MLAPDLNSHPQQEKKRAGPPCCRSHCSRELAYLVQRHVVSQAAVFGTSNVILRWLGIRRTWRGVPNAGGTTKKKKGRIIRIGLTHNGLGSPFFPLFFLRFLCFSGADHLPLFF